MWDKYLIPALLFMMKYFFDVEREITQQIVATVNLRWQDLRETVSGLKLEIPALNK